MNTLSTYSYIFVPSFAEATSLRKTMTHASDGGLVCSHVMTFLSFVADAWELYGDGRKLINPLERKLVAQEVCQNTQDGLSASFGTSLLLARCAESLTGLEAFETMLASLDNPDFCDTYGVSEEYRLFIVRIKAYRERLIELDRVEPGQAVQFLADAPLFRTQTNILMYSCGELTPIQKQFFESFDTVTLAFEGFGPHDVISRVQDGVDARFAFSSGLEAEALLVCDIVQDYKDQGPVSVVSPHPLEMYTRIAPALHAQGYCCDCLVSSAFGHTDIGRAFFAVYALCTKERLSAQDVSDFTYLRCSGMTKTSAWLIDAYIKSDRLYNFDCLRMQLREASPVFLYLEELTHDTDASILLGALSDEIRTIADGDDAYIAEQMAAIDCIRDVYAAACWLGVSVEQCVPLLEKMSVSVARTQISETNKVDVHITDMTHAASFEPGLFGVVVLTDMTSQTYPVKETEDICTALMDVLGIVRTDSALLRTRRMFTAAKNAASVAFIIERPLHDSSASPAYPCIAVEEFIDSYRDDPSAADDIDNDYMLPEILQHGMYERGEEALYANVALTHIPQEVVVIHENRYIDEVKAECGDMIVPLMKRGVAAYDKMVVSPSALEACVECPYKWFASRRLGLQGIAEEFGAREKGSYMHKCLEVFYGAFQNATKSKKVTSELVDVAQEIMSDTVQDVYDSQFENGCVGDRYIALTQIEERDLARLQRRLVNYVDFESRLLPSFKPTYFEFEIKPEDKVEYAGCYVSGKIDRIDIDDKGRAIIIDYKSSLGETYAIQNKTGYYKVQALVYASIIQKLLNVEVVGALYVNVLRHEISGAYNSFVLDSAELWGIKKPENLQVYGNFEDVLKVTEQRIAHIMESISHGIVHRNPAESSVCMYCPVTSCERREQ